MNRFLKEQKAVGEVVNDIKGGKKERSFYSKNGWVEVIPGFDSLLKYDGSVCNKKG